MRRFSRAVFFGLIFGVVLSTKSFAADEIEFLEIAQKGQWYLGLLDGRVGYYAELSDVKDAPNLPTFPSDKGGTRVAFRWLRTGDTFRIDVTQEQREETRAQAEKHHWFLSAKYTEKSGEVVLTEEETKYSHWQFLDENLDLGAEVPQYHIKNVNDLGKDAWLGMESKGVRFKGHIEIRKPILLFEKKQYIGVERHVPN